MANLQKSCLGTEAANDALNAIVSKALEHPKRGSYVGGGPTTAIMAPTWDGQGPCPWGWTKQVVANYVASALDSALPIPDDLAALLQGPPAQANLSGAEKGALTAAIAARAVVDLDAGGKVPKAEAVAQETLESEAKP